MYEIRDIPTEKINISKAFIESKISIEELWKYYIGIYPDTKAFIVSPLRYDKKPTCNWYYKGKNLYFKDFSGHFHGDLYNLVCYLNNLAYADLMGAMKIIVRDHANIFLGSNEKHNEYIRNLVVELKEEENRFRKIQIKKSIWTTELIKYWNDYEINPLSFLAANDVFCIQYLWLDGKLRYTYNKNDPAIAYYFGDGRYKIYFPFRTKGARFIGNSSAIQGYNQLPPTGDLLILTKSMKDVLVLKLLGFNACALQSEQHHLEQNAYEHLSKRFKRIVLLYDNDDAGRNGANKICDKYNLTYIEIPEDYEDCKDISDVSKAYDMQTAWECMNDLTYMWI